MTSAKGGKPTKDALISDGFNQQKLGPRASNALIRKARREAALAKQRIEVERKRQAAEFELMEKKLARAKKEVGIKDTMPAPVEEPTQEEPPPAPDEDEKSAHRMLQDLRYAYRNSVGPGGSKGKRRLVELMEADAEFKFAVRELLKIEAALMAAKIRKEGGDGSGSVNQSFFVVLKGLETEMPVISQGDKTVDMKQITRAMSPDESSYEPEEEEVSQRDAPEQLQKPVEGMEGE